MASIINFLDLLCATGDDEDSRLAERLRAVDTSQFNVEELSISQGPAEPPGPTAYSDVY